MRFRSKYFGKTAGEQESRVGRVCVCGNVRFPVRDDRNSNAHKTKHDTTGPRVVFQIALRWPNETDV